MTQIQKNFVKGAAVLAAAGIIVKIIGAFYRIPLARLIDDLGMGYYQQAYPIYATMVVISTAGLPTAISKLVSEKVAKNDFAGAHNTFVVAWRVLLILGIVMSVAMALLARPISMLQKSAPAVYSLLALSPALFFVSMISAYRGYFQGLQYMAPTAVSQMAEQAGKLAFGLVLAYLIYAETGRPELGAMGALLGVTISEVIALFYMMAMYRRRKNEILSKIEGGPGGMEAAQIKAMLIQIVAIAVPVMLGALISPITQAIDTVVVSRTLQGIGYTAEAAVSTFGILNGFVNPLINLPAVISLELAMSLVPTISQSRAENDNAAVGMKSSFGFKLALLVGLPCALAFFLLAEPILNFLYDLSGAKLEMAVGLFRLLSVGVLFLTVIQTMTGVLQGLGKPFLPVISLGVGAAAKVIASVILISNPAINVYGAAIGTLICYAIAAVMDVAFVVRCAKIRVSPLNHVIKPVLATMAMGAAVYLVYRALGSHSNAVGVLAALLLGFIVYFLALVLIKGLTRDELEMAPGGGKLARAMVKLKIWKS
jgi:stage V sporulation protein B